MVRTFIFLSLFILHDSLPSFAQDTSQTNGERQYFDSAYFSIIRGNYVTGERFFECYQNKLTKLDSTREYYQNGKLKEEGIMTSSNHIYVGVWRYYSQSGGLNSVVNYDNKQPISYFKALKIAETKGFRMPDIEVDETTYKNKKYCKFLDGQKSLITVDKRLKQY